MDGNFVEQFQTDGFDARLWELHLNSYLVEEQLFMDRQHDRPDFVVTKYGMPMTIEATVGHPLLPVRSANAPAGVTPPPVFRRFAVTTNRPCRVAQTALDLIAVSTYIRNRRSEAHCGSNPLYSGLVLPYVAEGSHLEPEPQTWFGNWKDS